MEETMSLIFHGCKLARDLESSINLPNLVNQPGIISRSCDEIIRVFNAARDRLTGHGSTSYGQTHEQPMSELEGAVHEWLRSKYVHGLPERRERGLEIRDVEASPPLGGGGGEAAQPMDVADFGGASSSQRGRRRKDDVDKRTVMVPAPRMGNTEIPPEDGYTWRKYGQKEILGSRFPRGYYRCTHQKLYNCPAKKQVQRLDNDPFTFQVTYRGDHTCHMSSTAPSAPPVSAEMMPPMTQPPPVATTTTSTPPTSMPLNVWLSMDIRSTGEGTSGFPDHPHVQFFQDFGLSGTRGSGAGPSTSRYGREVDNYQLPVADLADAMFNSGSSSNNSMDIIFSSMEDKWEPGDKNN